MTLRSKLQERNKGKDKPKPLPAKVEMVKASGAVVEARPSSLPPGFLEQANKRFGTGAIMVLGAGASTEKIPVVPFGIPSLDRALGVGGLPEGKIIELFGQESSGKSTLALIATGCAQRLGRIAAYVDAEHALDPGYATKLGVDLSTLLVSQPSSGEEALEVVEMLVSQGNAGMVVIDSVAALVPRAELEGEMGDSHVGLQARLMSQALRKLTAIISKHKAIVIFINQLRVKIGQTFGNPETTTGGNALKFYASLRLDVRRIGALKDGETVVGSRIRVKVVKNKVAPPFTEAELDLRYAFGLDLAADVLELAEKAGIVDKAGAWYSYGTTRLGQGQEAAKAYLRAQPEILAEIQGKLK